MGYSAQATLGFGFLLDSGAQHCGVICEWLEKNYPGLQLEIQGDTRGGEVSCLVIHQASRKTISSDEEPLGLGGDPLILGCLSASQLLTQAMKDLPSIGRAARGRGELGWWLIATYT